VLLEKETIEGDELKRIMAQVTGTQAALPRSRLRLSERGAEPRAEGWTVSMPFVFSFRLHEGSFPFRWASGPVNFSPRVWRGNALEQEHLAGG